jgi:hypothetical protein
VSAVPAAGPQPSGPPSAADWARIEAAAPEAAAVMRRYLRQLGTFLSPASVDAAENALRHLARRMTDEAGLGAVGDIRRDHIEDFKLWLAARPRGRPDDHERDPPAADPDPPPVLRADHRVGPARRPAPQPCDRLGHPEETRAAAEVPRRPRRLRPDPGLHGLGDVPVAGVAARPAAPAPVIAQVRRQLRLKGPLQDRPDQLAEHRPLAGQPQPARLVPGPLQQRVPAAGRPSAPAAAAAPPPAPPGRHPRPPP